MAYSAGTKLGPYEIVAPIGAGGMGEVYRAHDSRLQRDVAIKVSAQQFSDRFEREARAIAALNHSNICQVYDIGPNYLVMELVDGAPLAGPLPLDVALRDDGSPGWRPDRSLGRSPCSPPLSDVVRRPESACQQQISISLNVAVRCRSPRRAAKSMLAGQHRRKFRRPFIML
jgi:hypothetical protein